MYIWNGDPFGTDGEGYGFYPSGVKQETNSGATHATKLNITGSGTLGGSNKPCMCASLDEIWNCVKGHMPTRCYYGPGGGEGGDNNSNPVAVAYKHYGGSYYHCMSWAKEAASKCCLSSSGNSPIPNPAKR